MNKLFQLKGVGVKLSSNNSLGLISSFVDRYIKKFIAFTLAETLIVMGVIGIVAALTIPNLNNSTGDMEKVTRLKNVYSELNEAYGRAVAKYGPIGTWKNTCTVSSQQECFANRLMYFMKVSKVCGTARSGCFNNVYRNEGPKSSYVSGDCLDYGNPSYSFLLPNGVAVEICGNGRNADIDLTCNNTVNNIKTCGKIAVDIDGKNKGKNKAGIDYFSFSIMKDSIIPQGATNDGYGGTNAGSYCIGNLFVMSTCTAWVIENGNLDYLIAKEDGSGKLTCPNGKVLGWKTSDGQVTSCK